MTTRQQARRRSSQRLTISVVAVVSLAIHATIFATANVGFEHTEHLSGEESGARSLAGVQAAVEFSCWSDASLALAARELSCALPGIHSDLCVTDALRDFHFDWLLCDGLEDAVSSAEALAFLSPEEIDLLEPMPMLDVPEKDELELAKLIKDVAEEKKEEAVAAASNPRERGQVIEVTPPQLEAVPDTARFLSEFDSHTEKETVARGTTEKMVAKPAPKELPVGPKDNTEAEPVEPPVDALVAAAKEGKGAGDGVSDEVLEAMRELQFRPNTSAGDAEGVESDGIGSLGFRRGDGTRESRGREAREGQEASSGGGGQARPLIPNLRPSQDMLSRVAGGGSVDKLDGVESGDFTSLNTKKWKFASFFNRMKRQVAQNWHPDEVYSRRDPTGKVYGTKDRVTVLEVWLKPGGKLDKVVVLEQSGVDFLDSEAVAAFQRAQPFPNPPSALISSSGLISFSFGFHFQVGAPRGGWKVFRQR